MAQGRQRHGDEQQHQRDVHGDDRQHDLHYTLTVTVSTDSDGTAGDTAAVRGEVSRAAKRQTRKHL